MKFPKSVLALLMAAPIFVQAAPPHFSIQLKNDSDKDAALNFKAVVGDVYLTPTLPPDLLLPAHATTESFGVNFAPLDPKDKFSITFTGTEACVFTIGFFAPATPSVTIEGLGCQGGGYSIDFTNNVMTIFVNALK